MASITLTSLAKTNTQVSAVVYTDLHLDILGVPVDAVKDIRVDNDLDAIRNSLSNLFNTIPGQKLLNPTYGLNLLQYLFEPITTVNANSIGETILNGIKRYEPRVTVENVKVVGNIDANEYTITLSIRVPAFPNTDILKLNALLSQNSTFTFV